MDHQHSDGWISDEIFRSMRRNCEVYKKVKMREEQLKQENEQLKQENTRLQIVRNGNDKLITWSDYVLNVCKDGKQRTSREIFQAIQLMDSHPWEPTAKTPESTCGTCCLYLFQKKKVSRVKFENERHYKYQKNL